MIAVIGKLKDTARYVGKPGYNVQPFREDWSPAVRDE